MTNNKESNKKIVKFICPKCQRAFYEMPATKWDEFLEDYICYECEGEKDWFDLLTSGELDDD